MSTTALPTPAQAFPVAREPMALVEEALDRAYLPRASWMDDDEGGEPCLRMTPEGVAILDVCGVIDSRASWLWTGYDEVQAMAAQAFAHAGVAAVVLSLDSPGGVAAGMVDAGRALRAMADRAGKPLVAHAGPMAASAAYGLACAADKILVTEDGTVGSVGVLAVVTDRTAQNAAEGLNRRVIASGTMKADGHPDQALSDAALGRMRFRVMQLAGMFGAWVAARRGMTPEAVMALQGGVAYGADAVAKGLADSTGTLADAVALAAAMAADSAQKRKTTMEDTKASATLAALRTSAGVTTDEELVATLATFKHASGQLPALQKENAELKAQLTARDAADAAKARATVLDKHRERGALTPAMEADATFMADFAPLSAEALDRVLSRLPGAAAPVAPRTPASLTPTRAAAAPVGDREREFARATGVSMDAITQVAERDAAPKED